MVLLCILTVTTYVNLDRSRKQAQRTLQAQASAIVSGLAAGLRTGWRHFMWQSDSLQALVEEMAQTGDVAFVALLDKDGKVMAHSDPSFIGRSLPQLTAFIGQLDDRQIKTYPAGNDLYVAGRFLREDEFHPGQPGNSSGPGLMMRRRMMMNQSVQPAIILVGLKTTSYREAQKRQFQHALLMGTLLFVIGSAAIYFIFIVQNYRTIDRTLANLTTYTLPVLSKKCIPTV